MLRHESAVRHDVARSIGLILVLVAAPLLFGEQAADAGFTPTVDDPAWSENGGPVLLIDEAHNNFHTMEGRYKTFADVMRADGFRVDANREAFTRESLAKVAILVIANALNERNVEDWSLPTPSAFGSDEIEALRNWIEAGGALMLMVDHMPMPGCNEELANAFGITFSNGFARKPDSKVPLVFATDIGTLKEHPILDGRGADERVDRVATFAGSAFRTDGTVELQPLFVFPAGWISLEPVEAWEFKDDTPTVPVEGWYQGATMELGEGRIAVFGEAAMFTVRTVGDATFGLSHPEAPQNKTFLLNVVHWLIGLLDE